MKLFEFFASLLGVGDRVTIVLMKTPENKISVSVNPLMKDSSRPAPFVPPVVTGTPEEFDEHLVDAIKESVQQEVSLQVSIREHAESVKAAQKSETSKQAAKPAAKAATPAKPAEKAPSEEEVAAKKTEEEAKAAKKAEEDAAKAAEEAAKKAEDDARKAEAEKSAQVSQRWPEFIKAKNERRFADGLKVLRELEQIAVNETQKSAIARGIQLCENELAQPQLGL